MSHPKGSFDWAFLVCWTFVIGGCLAFWYVILDFVGVI